jgi:hypothetical protein
MADYSVPQAAAAVGRNRSSILRAIKSGRLTAARDDATGAWRIDASELHRLFPTVRASDAVGGDAPSRTLDASAELAELRVHHADAIRVRDDTIADLRRRLDTATQQLGEALQQVRLLTDQRTAAPAPARRSWWPWTGGKRNVG